MKNIIEVVKANKTIIIKRTLIALGAVAGLFIVGTAFSGQADIDNVGEFDDNENDFGDDTAE